MNHEGRTIEAPHILAETVQVRCDAIVGVLETGHHPLLPPEVNLSMRDARARAACDIAEALGAVVDLLRTHPVEMLHRRPLGFVSVLRPRLRMPKTGASPFALAI